MKVGYYNKPNLWTIGEVFERDNKRFVMLNESVVLEISPDDTLYNYIDKGRKVLLDGCEWYIFNNLKVEEDIIKALSNYQDKEKLDLTKLTDSKIDIEVFIFYDEDIKQVKTRLKQIKKEAQEEKTKELEETNETEKVNEFLKNWKDLQVIEDKEKRIENNILIDKKAKVKLVFTRKITELFNQEDLFETGYNRNAESFIKLDYQSIIGELEDRLNFYFKKEEESVEWIKRNPKRFTFKIYQLELKDIDDNKKEKVITKITGEKFLLNFSFVMKKGKCYPKYFINDIRIPKQKVSRALRKLASRYYGSNLLESASTYNTYLKNIKKYSQVQLELLEKGLSGKIDFDNAQVNVKVNVSNPDNDIWQIDLNKHSWKVHYSSVKHLNRRYVNDTLDFINTLVDAIGKQKQVEKVEDIAIDYLQKRRKEIEVFEKRAKKLWEDTITKYPDRILNQNGRIIVKGKLKTYELEVANDDVRVSTYPDHNYICIHSNTREGRELFIHDKLTQFALALMNDSNIGRERIHTLR